MTTKSKAGPIVARWRATTGGGDEVRFEGVYVGLSWDSGRSGRAGGEGSGFGAAVRLSPDGELVRGGERVQHGPTARAKALDFARAQLVAERDRLTRAIAMIDEKRIGDELPVEEKPAPRRARRGAR